MSIQSSASKKRVSSYFKGVRAELKKVIWPTKKELINYTGVVILISSMVSLVVWVLDLGIHQILSLIIK